MKRVISIITAVVLTVLGFSGCNSKKPASGEETGVTLSYWVNMDSNVATRIQSYNEVAMYKQREKDSGVHINFLHPANGQAKEQFNLMIASRDLPDMIEYSWTNYQGGVQRAIDDGVIVALNDYMEYAPNFNKALTDKNELSPVYKKGSLTDQGKYYGFTTLNTGDYRIFSGPAIRKDWLDELGLEVPETIDEWTTALKAFKEKKGAAAPMTGMLNTLVTGSVSPFVGAFGIGSRWYLDNGKVKYGPMQDNYKDFLALLNSWYKDGLLDRDISTNQQTLIDAKIINGDSGALVNAYLGSGLGRYLKQMQSENKQYNLVGTPYPVSKKGDVNRFPAMEGDVMNSSTVAITTACNDVKAAVEWMDYWYSDEGYMLLNFGIEGETYDMVDGKPVYKDTILKNPDGLSINEALLLDCRATAPVPGFKQAPEYLEQYYEFPQQLDALKTWVYNVEEGRKTLLPNIMPTLEESDEIASVVTDLNTYVNEMLWKFITGEQSLDKFDDFRNTVNKNFNMKRYSEIMQNQYDRYVKR